MAGSSFPGSCRRPRPRGWLSCAIVVLIVFLSGLAGARPSSAQIPCRYELQQILPPVSACGGSRSVFAAAISPNGRYVCGYWYCNAGIDRPFVWIAPQNPRAEGGGEGGTFITISFPGFVNGFANDVSDDGTVVGYVASAVLGQRGFVYETNGGAYALLSSIHPQGLCAATGINSNREVCGYRSIGSKGDPVNPTTAFRWTEHDGFTDLGVIDGLGTAGVAIDDFGAVVVRDFWLTGTVALLWSDAAQQTIGPLPNGGTPYPTVISTRAVKSLKRPDCHTNGRRSPFCELKHTG